MTYIFLRERFLQITPNLAWIGIVSDSFDDFMHRHLSRLGGAERALYQRNRWCQETKRIFLNMYTPR